MDPKLTKALKYTLSFCVAGVLLYFCFRSVSWKDFATALSDCAWGYVALSMLCGAGAFFFRGIRWRRMLLPVDGGTRLITTYDATTIGNISNFVFPYLGEIVRCGIVARNSRKASADKVFGTIAMDRIWDLLSLAAMFAFILGVKWNFFGDFVREKIWTPLAGRFAAAWIIPAAGILLLAVLIWLAVALRDRNSLCSKVCRFAEGIWKGFAACLRMKGKWAFLLTTVIIWLCYWLQIVLCGKAFPGAGSLGLSDCLFIMLVGSVASVVPVPGGFGAFHYLVALAMGTLYGMSWETGIVFATLVHESQTVTMLLTGGLSLGSQFIIRRRNGTEI